jgi:DNA topoisomerase-1
VERALELLRAKAEGPRRLGEKDGQPVYLLNGRFGAYVQLGETPDKADKKAPKPPRASLPSGITEANITLDDALRLLSLPRVVGEHPEDQQPILSNFGRFGPYIKHGDEFRSLESDDQVFTIDLDAAVALLREPKRSRRRQATTRKVLRELKHPSRDVTIKLLEGRYGPYVTDGTTNASLPKGTSPDSLTPEQAVELIEARAASGPSKPRGRTTRRTTAGRSRGRTRKAAPAEA